MIVVHATYDIKEGCVDKFIELAQECLEKSPREKGNIRYSLVKDAINGTPLMCIEEWADEEAFQAHLNMPYYVEFSKARQPYFNTPVHVNKFQATAI